MTLPCNGRKRIPALRVGAVILKVSLTKDNLHSGNYKHSACPEELPPAVETVTSGTLEYTVLPLCVLLLT